MVCYYCYSKRSRIVVKQTTEVSRNQTPRALCQSHFCLVQSLCKALRYCIDLSCRTPPFLTLCFTKKDQLQGYSKFDQCPLRLGIFSHNFFEDQCWGTTKNARSPSLFRRKLKFWRSMLGNNKNTGESLILKIIAGDQEKHQESLSPKKKAQTLKINDGK